MFVNAQTANTALTEMAWQGGQQEYLSRRWQMTGLPFC
jgi:hypothetical protein